MGATCVGGAVPGVELGEDCMGLGHQVLTHCPREHSNARQATKTAALERLFAFLEMAFAVFEITFESTLILFASLLIPSASLLTTIASWFKAIFSACIFCSAASLLAFNSRCCNALMRFSTRSLSSFRWGWISEFAFTSLSISRRHSIQNDISAFSRVPSSAAFCISLILGIGPNPALC